MRQPLQICLKGLVSLVSNEAYFPFCLKVFKGDKSSE